MKNTQKRINSSLEDVEKTVSNLEDRIVKLIQAEQQKIKRHEHRL